MVGFAVVFYALTRGLWWHWRYWLWVALAALVAVGLVVPFFLPYARDSARRSALRPARSQMPTMVGGRLAGVARLARMGASVDAAAARIVERGALPGFLLTLVGLAGIVVVAARRSPEAITPTPRSIPDSPTARRPHETARALRPIGGIAFWISFGPKAGLYTLFYHYVPAFELLRAPARLASSSAWTWPWARRSCSHGSAGAAGRADLAAPRWPSPPCSPCRGRGRATADPRGRPPRGEQRLSHPGQRTQGRRGGVPLLLPPQRLAPAHAVHAVVDQRTGSRSSTATATTSRRTSATT
jgi:hypothetical protein